MAARGVRRAFPGGFDSLGTCCTQNPNETLVLSPKKGAFGADPLRATFASALGGFVPESEEDRKLVAGVKTSLFSTKAASTLGSYSLVYFKFRAWCMDRGRDPVGPNAGAWATLWFQSVANDARSFATVKTAHAMLCCLGERLQQPRGSRLGDLPLLKATLEAAKRRIGVAVRNQKEPVPWEYVEEGALLWLGSGVLVFQMAAVMAVVSFAGWLRYSDTSGLRGKDVRFFEKGAQLSAAELSFPEGRKADKYRQGSRITLPASPRSADGKPADVCVVQLLYWWMQQNGVGEDEFLFRKFDGYLLNTRPRDVKFGREAIPREQVVNLYGRMFAEVVYHDHSAARAQEFIARFGTHGMRHGGCTDAAPRDGRILSQSEEDLHVAQGGWKDRRMLAVYRHPDLDVRLQSCAGMSYVAGLRPVSAHQEGPRPAKAVSVVPPAVVKQVVVQKFKCEPALVQAAKRRAARRRVQAAEILCPPQVEK